MKVSLNTNYNYKSVKFGDNAANKNHEKEFTDKEIKIAKVKKTVSECATVCFGIGILYFAMKHNFKINRIKNIDKKMQESSKVVLPKIKMAVPTADDFIKV